MAKETFNRFATSVHVGLGLDQQNLFSIVRPLADHRFAELFDRNLVLPRNLVDDQKPKLCRVRSCFLPGFPRPTTSFTNRFPKILMRHYWDSSPPSFALPEPLAWLQLPRLLPRSELELLQPTAVPRSPSKIRFIDSGHAFGYLQSST